MGVRTVGKWEGLDGIGGFEAAAAGCGNSQQSKRARKATLRIFRKRGKIAPEASPHPRMPGAILPTVSKFCESRPRYPSNAVRGAGLRVEDARECTHPIG